MLCGFCLTTIEKPGYCGQRCRKDANLFSHLNKKRNKLRAENGAAPVPSSIFSP